MVVNIIREALLRAVLLVGNNSIYNTLGHSGSCVHIVAGKQNLVLSGRVGVNQGYLAITTGHRFVDAVVRLTCCRSRNHSRQSEPCYGTSRFLSNILCSRFLLLLALTVHKTQKVHLAANEQLTSRNTWTHV